MTSRSCAPFLVALGGTEEMDRGLSVFERLDSTSLLRHRGSNAPGTTGSRIVPGVLREKRPAPSF